MNDPRHHVRDLDEAGIDLRPANERPIRPRLIRSAVEGSGTATSVQPAATGSKKVPVESALAL